MTKPFIIAGILALSSQAAPVQRSVVLTWEDLRNPDTTTYNVYRANGDCLGASATAFARVASALLTKTHTDLANPGKYCYYVTSALAGQESLPSNNADAKVLPWQPQKLEVKVD